MSNLCHIRLLWESCFVKKWITLLYSEGKGAPHSSALEGRTVANFKINKFLQAIQSFLYCLYSNIPPVYSDYVCVIYVLIWTNFQFGHLSRPWRLLGVLHDVRNLTNLAKRSRKLLKKASKVMSDLQKKVKKLTSGSFYSFEVLWRVQEAS